MDARMKMMIGAAIAVVLILVIVLASVYGPKKHASAFWGGREESSPYVRLSGPEFSSWAYVEKPDLTEMVPEYNFQSKINDYKFGGLTYHSDSGSIN